MWPLLSHARGRMCDTKESQKRTVLRDEKWGWAILEERQQRLEQAVAALLDVAHLLDITSDELSAEINRQLERV